VSSFRGGWGGPSYRAYGGGGYSRYGYGWGLTPVVKKLILINAVVFFALLLLKALAPTLYLLAIYWLGVVPGETVLGLRFWQPLTYLFVHAGFLHVFFNMFGLWMFGSVLERDWGGRRFLRYYLLTGIGAGLLNVIVSLLWGGAAATVPTIGASGAIFALLLAFGVLYPHQPIFVWFLFPVPARIFVIIFGALAFISALQEPGSSVSHVSHLGGMLFGLIYLRGGWLLYRMRRRWANWKMREARRRFEVYMREEDERERSDRGPGQWIN